MEEENIKGAVRDAYAKVAKNEPRNFAMNSCCGGSTNFVSDISLAVGYKKEDLDSGTRRGESWPWLWQSHRIGFAEKRRDGA